MKVICSAGTIIIVLLVFEINITHVVLFNLKCPPQGNWKLRATAMCNSILKYFCLFNNAKQKYVEGCKGPDWDRKGSKRIFSGFFTRGICKQTRFQPFIFQTNESMSDCIYAKSLCSEEGQIFYNDHSRKDDRTCRCDYKKNFSFVKSPRNLCYCIPTEEDCSCHIKSCPVNLTLLADYDCSSRNHQENQKCRNFSKHHGIDTIPQDKLKKNDLLLNTTTYMVKQRAYAIAGIVICSGLVLVAGMCLFVVLFTTWTSIKYQHFKRYVRSSQTELKDRKNRNKTESEITIEENSCKSNGITSVVKDQKKLSTEEINFLRLIHLVFRVACPVVRMIFDNEIQPNQLRKTLDKHKELIVRKYRKKDKIINDVQWDLLFPKVHVKIITSEDFDIRLMVHLLRILARIDVGDELSEQADRSICAMLSIIKNVRNEVTRRIRGELSDSIFYQNWDTLGNAVLKLQSSFTIDMYNQEKMQLVGCSNVTSIHSPKEFPIPNTTRQFTDITTEEYNFLVVFHGLTRIIYPLIKEEFDIHCNDEVLDKILKNAYDQKRALRSQESRKDEHKRKRKRIYLSQDQRDQLYPPDRKLPKNVDLKWMISILKHVAEESDKKEYIEHLELTDELRREIVQSSSGVLDKTIFQDILKRSEKAALYFGGKEYKEKVLNLQDIRII